MPTMLNQNTVSAGQARQQLGQILDKAYYRNQSFVVERAGEPRAVIVPLSQYDEMQRLKQQAKQDFFEMTGELQEAFSDLDATEINNLVDEAVKEVRAEKMASTNARV